MTDESSPGNEAQAPLIQWDINKAAIAKVAEELKDIDPYKDLDGAKKAKQKLVKMRSTLSEYHKETKAKALAFGKECDTKKNEYMALIRAIEDPIGEELDKIKNAAAIEEEARVAKIMAEIERIQAYSLDRHSLTLEELEARLSDLRDQVLDKELLEEYIEDAHLAKDEADLKLRLAIDREKTDLAEREEKAELERKNAELQAELEESRKANEDRDRKQAEYDTEQARIIKEAADKEAADQKEKDDARQQELDDQQAEIDRQTKEREDAEKAEAEALFEANEKQKAEELAALQAPDVDKLNKYADAVDQLIRQKPVMGSTAGNEVMLQAVSVMIEVVYDIRTSTEEMK